MADITIPASLLPADGRFGCGPSKVRTEQLDFLATLQPGVLGTSHRQAPVKNLVGSVRAGLSELFRAPEGYEILLANGGATTFWDSAIHSLIEQRSQHLAFGEFGAKFAKAAQAAPFLQDPDVRSADAGSRSQAEAVAGVDVYAFPHNETSTGVMAEVKRVHGDAGALTVVDATSGAGGLDFDASETDVYYFSPQKNFASDGGIWFALVSPAAIERIERVTASGRYIPETLNLTGAIENSRKDQTLNTPALSTLALMDEQLRWINGNGGLSWAAGRTAESAAVLYDWAERTPVATPVRHRRRAPLERRRDHRLRRLGGRLGDLGRAPRERRRRHRALPQAGPQPAARRDLHRDRARRCARADGEHRLRARAAGLNPGRRMPGSQGDHEPGTGGIRSVGIMREDLTAPPRDSFRRPRCAGERARHPRLPRGHRLPPGVGRAMVVCCVLRRGLPTDTR